jgi:hypothetical protein
LNGLIMASIFFIVFLFSGSSPRRDIDEWKR